MGVPVADWARTVANHPAKFKFEGLDGFHDSLREAYANDDDAVQKLIDQREEHNRKLLDGIIDGTKSEECDELSRYFEYLRGQITVSQLPEDDLLFLANLGSTNVSEEDCRKAIAIFEEAAGSGNADYHRMMFSACDEIDWSMEREFMAEADMDWLLEQYPLQEVYTHAGQYGIPAEDVVFICPSCGREPHSIETLNDMGGHFYCGLCGAEHQPDTEDERDLTVEANLKKFAEALDVNLYPFRVEEVCQSE